MLKLNTYIKGWQKSCLRSDEKGEQYMTEAVILVLIALVGSLLFTTIATVLVNIVLKSKPSHIIIDTEYGHFEAEFDTKAGK